MRGSFLTAAGPGCTRGKAERHLTGAPPAILLMSPCEGLSHARNREPPSLRQRLSACPPKTPPGAVEGFVGAERVVRVALTIGMSEDAAVE
jgi:hypothetical protein